MKCIAANCKHEAVIKVNRLWGKVDTVGFCDKHTPPWAKGKSPGTLSPPVPMFDNKSFYQVVQ